MAENQIILKTITELLGLNFYIPEYQRGYRWTKNNVLQLLNDIWEYRKEPNNRNTFYCLQPVVVRKTQWKDIAGESITGYELIDGQQRLTTIHRILTFILLERYNKIELTSRGYQSNLFSIYYKTRLESKTFLESNGLENTRIVPESFLEYLQNVVFANFDVEKGDFDLSRNSASHGVASDEQYTRSRALQAILILDQIYCYI